MEYQPCSIWYSLKCLLQHGSYHAQSWAVRDCIADQITVVQIQNRRKIYFLPKQTELGYVGHPFLVWFFRIEVPVAPIPELTDRKKGSKVERKVAKENGNKEKNRNSAAAV